MKIVLKESISPIREYKKYRVYVEDDKGNSIALSDFEDRAEVAKQRAIINISSLMMRIQLADVE